MLINMCAKPLGLLSIISVVSVLAACGGGATKSTSVSESSSQAVASQVEQPSSQAALSSATVATAAAVVSAGNSVPPSANQCDDGIDNDGDGLVDWQYDVGCSDANDTSEAGLSRSEENGWTTFNPSADSKIVYVSSGDGDDNNDGLSPTRAVATLSKGVSLVRDGYPDFLLLKRGDTWRDENLGRFKSGRSDSERLVVSSYGDSINRPVVEISNHFISDAGRGRSHLAIVGLELLSYMQDPNGSDFEGQSAFGLRFVGDADNNILFEDNYFNYSKVIVSTGAGFEFRRNIVYRVYNLGSCDAGHSSRPQGLYMSYSQNALVEDNIFDGNGWNESLPQSGSQGACATMFNHNLYVTDVNNLVVKNNLFLRASSIGLKVSALGSGGVKGLLATDNLFAEGEIGIEMHGNSFEAYTHVDSELSNNVFTDISRTRPTKRDLSWGIVVGNNDNVAYRNNLFVNPLQVEGNNYAYRLRQETNRDVLIEGNLAHGYIGSPLKIYEGSSWRNVEINNNYWVANAGAVSPLVSYHGDFGSSGVSYSGNSYYSSLSASSWFYRNNGIGYMSLEQWAEPSAVATDYVPSDAGRNVDSYAGFLGVGTTLDDFAVEARKQSRFNYRTEYEAESVNAYIRDGYKP